MEKLRLTVLGSGTSMGVPTLGCHCHVCESQDPRDKRLRPSVMLEYGGRVVVIDTTPDFRTQAMHERIERLDAILYTHGHADHILGLDDIRPYNLKQGGAVPVYASQKTLAILERTFAYIFSSEPTESSVPGVELHRIDETIELFGLAITPVPAEHGPDGVLGFRFGKAAYLTDFNGVPEESKRMLRGLDDFVLDALRYVPHPMHSTVEQSLALVKELQPKRAWFTHICHDLGHQETNSSLPENVRLTHDGLKFEVEI